MEGGIDVGSFFNRSSFYFSFLYIAFLFLIALNSVQEIIFNWTGIHPFKVLFYITIIMILCAGIGFFGVHDWKSAFRSIFTVGFSLMMLFFLAYIIFVGNISD